MNAVQSEYRWDSLVAKFESRQISRLKRRHHEVEFGPGDTVCVSLRLIESADVERVQRFEGVCIARSKSGINANFTIRKISYGCGVERVFPLYSTQIIDIAVKKRGIVHRGKLYYLRGLSGRSAKIAERQDGKIAQTQEPLTRFRGILHAMSMVLDRLEDLNGAAVGNATRDAVAHVRSMLPSSLRSDESRSAAYELVLDLLEHVCPLMFSSDHEIAGSARKAVVQMGSLLSDGAEQTSDACLVTSLRHLKVSIVLHLRAHVDIDLVEIQLAARDLYMATTGRDGNAVALLKLKIIQEDLRRPEGRTLDAKELIKGEVQLLERIRGTPEYIAAQSFTLFANGRELVRFRPQKNVDYVFVI